MQTMEKAFEFFPPLDIHKLFQSWWFNADDLALIL